MKIKRQFRGVPKGQIYPKTYNPGDTVPPELVDAAKAVNADQEPPEVPESEPPAPQSVSQKTPDGKTSKTGGGKSAAKGAGKEGGGAADDTGGANADGGKDGGEVSVQAVVAVGVFGHIGEQLAGIDEVALGLDGVALDVRGDDAVG